MSTDPLVFMHVERWSELKAVFKSDLARSISGFILLEAQEYILKCGLDYGFKIYCPSGDVKNGIVALNIKPTLYEVIIQCPKDDTKELEESLKNTKIIDWGKFAMVPYAPKHIVECVKRLYLAKKFKINHMIETTTFVLDKGVLPYDVRIPSGLSFELLTLDYLQLINEKWPYKYPGSDWIYELLIKAKLGYGLFDGKKLLAWIFIKEMGALGHLYTMDEHRRKGYGELTLKLMSNSLLKEVERWSELKAVFKSDWPRSISGYTVLETEEYILKSGINYGFKVYCPFGDINNGIVALNIKKTFYEVIIQCPKDDTKELEKALANTKLIDWSKYTEVPYAPKHVLDCVKRLCIEKNCKIDHIAMTETFILDKGAAPFDVRLPPDISFELLSLDCLQLINEKWPHKYHGSDWYFQLLIKAKLGYGLYNGQDLLAWIFVKEMGALGHLYTMEEHRRKGYGELALKLMSNLLLKEGKYVVAFCSAGNWTAANLYKKLGFGHVHEVFWCNSGSLL